MILFIAGCCLTASAEAQVAHGGIACVSCHGVHAATHDSQTAGCVVCHLGHARIFDHAMALRSGEKRFVQRTYGRVDSEFWGKNCNSCHLKSCQDCHGDSTQIRKPTVADCQVCHKGYYTGWDYSGRAPREDNMRYQRGVVVEGETFLKMLPDVHYRAGLTCGACHSMTSLADGQKSSKGCRDCHIPSMKPVEHRITAHMERLECYACHSAWAAQEYGTFFLRFRDRKMKEDFALKPGPGEEYLQSSYLRKQDEPPLGINNRGRISPIRPMFIAYYTDIMTARNNGPENTLLGAEWRAWFPHTVQRGSVTCEGCHDNQTRFLLEPESRRIYNLRKDGMSIESFWLQAGQRVSNGSFVDANRYSRISNKSPAYKKAYIEKWKQFINRVENSSRP